MTEKTLFGVLFLLIIAICCFSNVWKWLKKKLINKYGLKHEYDFEGRCEECGKNLNLTLKRISKNSVKLESVECSKHKGKTMILWPQRDDIIDKDENEQKDAES